MPPKPAPRNNYLDWLRVLAILYVFVYHSTRFFNLEDWYVKNPVTYQWVEIWNIFSWNWMMPLIFVISGASLFYAVGRGSPVKFIKDKVLRLLVPWLFGIMTHATIQVYLERHTHGVFVGSYFEFLSVYFHRIFNTYGIAGIMEFEELHLWYLWWLFLFTLLTYPLFLWLKRGGSRVLSAVSTFIALPGAVYLLALPSTLLLALADPDSSLMAEKGGGWSYAIYLWLLIAGFLLMSSEGVAASIKRVRWLSLGLGVALLAPTIYYAYTQGVPAYGTTQYTVLFTMAGLSSWCWILAWYGLAMRYLDYRAQRLDYANEAVLPFYILHQTVLICVGYFVVQWPIPDALKWAVILVVSFAVIMGLYEYLVRRFNLLRFLFGMKVIPRRKEVPATETPATA